MEETAAVFVHLDAGCQCIFHVTRIAPAQQVGIGFGGQHHAYVNAREGRRLQRLKHHLGRHEVGRLYVEVSFGVLYHPREAIHQVGIARHGVGRYDLYECRVCDGRCRLHQREIGIVAQQFLAHEIPVGGKDALQPMHGCPLHAQVKVAPCTALFSLFAHISQGQVHAAHIAHSPVDDAHLAMVAIVCAVRQAGEAHRQEGLHLNASLLHTAEKGCVHIPAAHIVVEQAHLNAPLRTVHEGVGHQKAHGIVLDDVRLQMNMVLCLLEVAQQ